jgi:hypothetical protein
VKRMILRRPSPATAIACIALFVALGGVSYGFATGSIDSREIRNENVHSQDIRNNSIRTDDLRNNEVRGRDIRNSTVRGPDVAFNSLGGPDVRESTLGAVPSAARATDADTLDGKDSSAFQPAGQILPFSLKLQGGETTVIAGHGQLAVAAQCLDNDAGNDTARLLVVTASDQALMDGADVDDDHLTSANYLNTFTPPGQRELAAYTRLDSSTPEVSDTNGGGYAAGPDGKGLHLDGGQTTLGFDYAGAKCLVAGQLVKTG